MIFFIAVCCLMGMLELAVRHYQSVAYLHAVATLVKRQTIAQYVLEGALAATVARLKHQYDNLDDKLGKSDALVFTLTLNSNSYACRLNYNKTDASIVVHIDVFCSQKSLDGQQKTLGSIDSELKVGQDESLSLVWHQITCVS